MVTPHDDTKPWTRWCLPMLACAFVGFPVGCRQGPVEDHTTAIRSSTGDTTVSLLFWNVENLFDLTLDGTEYPEYRPGQHGWDQFTYETKLNNIAAVLAEANAGIVGLCEVENERVLFALAEHVRQRGVDYPFHAVGNAPNPTTNMPCLLSRYPIIRTNGLGTVRVDNYWSRNILESDIALGPDTLKVFVCHWPSKRHAESHRLAAARVLAKRLRELPAGCDYLIAGDLNADYNECETFLTGGFDDTRGVTGVNHTLGTVQSQPRGFVDFVYEPELAVADSLRHYDLWLELDESRRGSHCFRGQWGTPDHVLLPRSLYDQAGMSYVDSSFQVFTMDDSLLWRGEPRRWLVTYRKGGKHHAGKGYSDHLPLTARFRAGGFRGTLGRAPEAPETGDCLGLETGREGWLGAARGVTVSRAVTSEGRALRIAGEMGKQNGTVAKVRLPCWLYKRRRPSRVALNVAGEGRFCFRVKPATQSKWKYYAPQAFSPSGRASYQPAEYASWERVTLPLAGGPTEANHIDLEVRAGKRATIDLYLDHVCVE